MKQLNPTLSNLKPVLFNSNTTPSQLKYILGLDVGIGSVGWSVVAVNDNEEPIGLVDLGVRTFKVPEEPKTGASLNLSRREARGRRRTLRSKRNRVKQVRQILSDFNLIQDNDVLPNNTWELRVKGLDEQLDRLEWAAVLLNLVKRRGYLSQRKSEAKDIEKEAGAVLSSIAHNSQLLQSMAYRSPAELALNHFLTESGSIRNRSKSYSHCFNRLDLLAEIQLLFKRQRELGSIIATEALEESVITLFLQQKPAISGEAILALLGKCTFEPTEYKMAKNSYSAERFIWLSKLANLHILEEGSSRPLSTEERQIIIEQPYLKAKLTFTQVRKLLNLPEKARFNLARDAENATFIELKGYHTLRKLVSEVDGDYWQKLKENSALMNDIATAFSLFKTDDDLLKALDGKLPEAVLNHLIENLNFDKFINLSQKALDKLLPLMEQGESYTNACMAVYGSTRKSKAQSQQQFLPPVDKDEIRNPVVLRAVSQTRKVINAIIREYGSLQRVHIESARELGKSFKERQEIKKQQKQNQAERASAREKFKAIFPHLAEPKAKDILKWRLYELQNGVCLYTGQKLDITKLLEKGYVEVDHALPFSRTFDDSFNNKALVLAKENQEKGNKTPYEYLNGEQWEAYVKRVESCQFSYGKKQRLLIKKLDEKSFLERNLNDTRYIATFLREYIRDNLHLAGKGKEKVFSPNGQMTAFLRGRWGLTKEREINCRHHALDAVVIACSTVSMQQKITQFSKFKEGSLQTAEYIDRETGEILTLSFPEPWKGFSEEVKIRTFSDNPVLELKTLTGKETLDFEETIKPLFVSQAPERKMKGRAHADTIRSAKLLDKKISTLRVGIENLDLKKLETLHNKETSTTYPILKARLEAFNDNAKKAFEQPIFDKNGSPIRTVKLQTTQNSGVRINGGIANNDSLVQVNIYQNKQSKHFLTAPIYAWQVAQKIQPTKWVFGKTEDDWKPLTQDDQFLFDLKTGDLVRIETSKDVFIGYFATYDRASGGIGLTLHDKSTEKKAFNSTIKTVKSITKLNVDVLGRIG